MKRSAVKTESYNLYEAKTALSRLVEEAAAGKEIVIAKNGTPMARLMPIRKSVWERLEELGPNPLGITYIAPDFDEPVWTEEELKEWGLA